MIEHVYVFHGKSHSGKDYCCDILQNLLEEKGLKVLRLAFGDYVKATVSRLYGITEYHSPEGRSAMQQLGTNLVRAYDPDFWCDTVGRLATALQPYYDVLIISDARFLNEIECIKDYFPQETITVKIERKHIVDNLNDEQHNHESETALDNYDDWDWIIQNIDNNPEAVRQQLEQII